jgi:GTPase SAR1 family protein
MYSVEDRKSFESAIDSLYELRHDEVNEYSDTPSSVIILVANKVDLVRTRVVLEQGEFFCICSARESSDSLKFIAC